MTAPEYFEAGVVIGKEDLQSMRDEITEAQRQNEILAAGIRAVRELIDDSEGVDGLHHNDMIASWEEIQRGADFESWLLPFNDAEDVLKGRP